jgi:hypothetical protein
LLALKTVHGARKGKPAEYIGLKDEKRYRSDRIYRIHRTDFASREKLIHRRGARKKCLSCLKLKRKLFTAEARRTQRGLVFSCAGERPAQEKRSDGGSDPLHIQAPGILISVS